MNSSKKLIKLIEKYNVSVNQLAYSGCGLSTQMIYRLIKLDDWTVLKVDSVLKLNACFKKTCNIDLDLNFWFEN